MHARYLTKHSMLQPRISGSGIRVDWIRVDPKMDQNLSYRENKLFAWGKIYNENSIVNVTLLKIMMRDFPIENRKINQKSGMRKT